MLYHRIMGTGKPILILHGVSLDHQYMMDVLEPVFQTQTLWQRVYIDLPGHGNSPPQNSIKSQDDVLQAIIDFTTKHLPAEPFALIGLSRGSYLARGFIHRHPDRISGAALILPGGNPSSDPARLPLHTIVAPNADLREELTASELWAYDNMTVIQTREIVDKRRNIIGPARQLFDAIQEARVFSNFEFSFHQAEETSIFERPSLLVAGRQDSISGYLDAIDLLPKFPRATLGILDCAGHGLAWERPDLFQSLLRDWLDRVASFQP